MNSTTSFWHAAIFIARRDLLAELRNRQILTTMILFGVMTTMIFYYVLESRPEARRAIMPAALWVSVVFAGTLGIGRSLAAEQERGTLDALLLAPMPRGALFMGKLLTGSLYNIITAVMVSIALNFVFSVDVLRPDWLLMTVLGAFGFAIIATLLGTMTVYARGREIALPVITMPLAIPLVIVCSGISGAILEDLPFADWWRELAALAVIDITFLALSVFLFSYVIEE
jgi:heme exporter protein B